MGDGEQQIWTSSNCGEEDCRLNLEDRLGWCVDTIRVVEVSNEIEGGRRKAEYRRVL